MRSTVIAIALLTAQTFLPAQVAPSATPAAVVTWEPAALVNGAPILFRVKPPVPLTSLRGLWLTRPVVFDFDAAGETWFALAGVGLDVSEGEYPLELEGVAADGSTVAFRAPVGISRGDYRTVDLTVAQKFTAPDAKIRARIAREQKLKQELFARVTMERAWRGRFSPPVSSNPTDSFGVRRTFNGVQQSVHQGADYRARTGTAVAAMNSGRVILARNLFFEGRCIVIDHGQGLLTLYMHLSKFGVKEGDLIARGQVIGSSGATGRVTAPHLHVSVRWHGIYLDPRVLVSLAVPR